ncbi:hypothetical protein [uncultured Methylobacterium sp.]|uniref:hypothetical protein n=1 Tax=uncultured Methylobacterium sp. TaxID=157278 RepID=UPI0035C9EE12
MPRRALAIAAALASLAPPSARAQDISACARFAWSVERERAAFAGADLPVLASGSALPATGASVRLNLQPTADLALPFPSDRSAKPGTFAGFITVATPVEAGTYHVTVSEDAWIDIGQDGTTALKPTSLSAQAGCPEVRKSARFALRAAPVTIQISRASARSIKVGFVRSE